MSGCKEWGEGTFVKEVFQGRETMGVRGGRCWCIGCYHDDVRKERGGEGVYDIREGI